MDPNKEQLFARSSWSVNNGLKLYREMLPLIELVISNYKKLADERQQYHKDFPIVPLPGTLSDLLFPIIKKKLAIVAEFQNMICSFQHSIDHDLVVTKKLMGNVWLETEEPMKPEALFDESITRSKFLNALKEMSQAILDKTDCLKTILEELFGIIDSIEQIETVNEAEQISFARSFVEEAQSMVLVIKTIIPKLVEMAKQVHIELI